jgi:outer membrane cobalamin receptor
VQLGGASGGARQIRLRGINSVHAKNPVILIDNIRVTPLGYAGPRGLQSVALLEMVDPGDITRVEVLRGPAATIQYADASDGVIRIFTRRGSEQPVAQAAARPECKTKVRKP